MTSDHEYLVARLRERDPHAGAEHDRLIALNTLITPIIRARHNRGWTQRDLAREAGVQQPVIARMEVGDTEPTIGTLRKLTAALGLKLVVIDDETAA